MKQITLYALLLVCLACCTNTQHDSPAHNDTTATTDSVAFTKGYSDVNGIKMYYETYHPVSSTGSDTTWLVLIHGGGSTIESTWGRVIPLLAKKHNLIAVDLQNHGRSGHRSVPETFEQDADDVVALLKNLNITKANFFGFSNGGHTALQIAFHHPGLVNTLIIASSPVKRNGFMPGFFESMPHAMLDNMPKQLREAFLAVTPDSAKLQNMFEKDRNRMVNFKDFGDAQLKAITAPTLLINGDADVITPEHAVEMHRLISHSQLAILPGAHGKYIGEITTLSKDGKDTFLAVPLVEEFLGREK